MPNPLNIFTSLGRFIITLSCVCVIFFSYLLGFEPFELLELKTYDLRLISRGKIRPSGDIVLAVIDEKSLEKEGRWPWPRKKLAQMVNILSQEGARVIGFDIGFLEPDRGVDKDFMRDLEQALKQVDIGAQAFDPVLKDLEQKYDNDFILAKALKTSSAQIVLGYFFHMTKESLNYSIDRSTIQHELAKLEKSKYPLVVFEKQDVTSAPFIEAFVPVGNLETFTNAAPYSGYFNIFTDPDGVVRRLPLVIKCGEDVFPPLSIQAAWHYLGRPQLMVKVSESGIYGIQVGNRFLPTDPNGQMMINYLGPPKTFPHVSITDILHHSFRPNLFRNTIVLVGATAVGIYDQRNTPFSPVYPGLEVHATVVDNILKQRFIIKPRWSKIYDIFALILLGLFSGILGARLRGFKGGMALTAILAGHIAITFGAFMVLGVWLNIVYPGLAILLTYAILALFNYLTEEKERKKIKNAFVCYLAPPVVNRVFRNMEKLTLKGEKKPLTVLFTDIRRFNTLVDSTAPKDLVSQLNQYHTRMTDIIFHHFGTLDKYMGDAIMAIYGAPMEMQDHAVRACQTALDMLKALEELNVNWVTEGKQALDMGIGISTGNMVVGNLGSEQRFEYSVAGSPVTTGAILEKANKLYKTKILVSEDTYQHIKGKFVCMEVDKVKIKHNQPPISIYQLIGSGYVPEKRLEAVTYFEKGLNLYRQKRWDKAIEFFQYVFRVDPAMQVAEVYIRRCKRLSQQPPPPDWDGVFTLEAE